MNCITLYFQSTIFDVAVSSSLSAFLRGMLRLVIYSIGLYTLCRTKTLKLLAKQITIFRWSEGD